MLSDAPEEAQEDGEGVRESSAALLGGTYFDDKVVEEGGLTTLNCSEDDRALFRQIMLLGRTVALGSAIRDCVRFIMTEGDGTFGPYQACSNDPYPRDAIGTQVEGVLRMLTTPHAVEITCTTGNIGVTRIAGKYDLPLALREPFDIPNPPLDQMFDATWLTNTAYGAAATHDEADFRARIALIAPRSALVWHEAMHVHAYRHDCGSQTYFQSVPYIVQYCLQQVAQRSADFCDMRGGCAVGGERALIDSYPISHSTECECVRDAIGDGQAEISATPKLDKREPADAFGSALAAGDFNGDGFEDLAVGAPGEDGNTGRVFIYLGSIFGLYAERTIDQQELDQDEAGDRFGSSLAAFDLDRDQLTDLVIGAPGEDNNTGAVYVFRGTRRGLEAAQTVSPDAQVSQNPGAPARFGEALAAGSFVDITQPVLAVGAPGTARGQVAGSVHLFAGRSANAGILEWIAKVTPESPEGHRGDRMGAALGFGSLAASSVSALVIGAPADARGGAVYVLPAVQSSALSANRNLFPAYSVHSNLGHKAGFGHALTLNRTLGPGTLAVGAPGASLGRAERAGQVSFFRATPSGAERLQELVGSRDGAALGTALLSTGRRYLHDEILVGSAKSEAIPLLQAKASFDTTVDDFRAVLTRGPGSQRAFALARGDFDGNGTLDLAVGIPDEASNARTATGGTVELFRRNDFGEWVRWGRYQQGD